MNSPVPSFQDVVRSRHSVRGFLPTPIPQDLLEEILQDAQWAPSNCNTQPWNVHIVSGDKLKALSAVLVEALKSENYTFDFSFDTGDYPEPYKKRAADQGGRYYQALGVARGDSLTRAEVVERNVRFFGAPHVAFLFMPLVGDNVRAASDVGMYAQTFLLSLAARGYAGVPQTILGFFAETVRQALGVSSDWKLLFGISFGTPDSAHAAFNYREDRIPLQESVVWHE
ncbi:nitroreductase [Klebsiella oxytoca]|uniref:nitroreductase n=2 Tax=Gammaproteobacteria TaxID=1236 RepID=UPI00163FA635|nr:nitroreductase [Shewanella algae]MBK0678683.1 nitroreductase [Klebsiella oxytoca]QNI00320.1 nitroreductase [Shewanella algae]